MPSSSGCVRSSTFVNCIRLDALYAGELGFKFWLESFLTHFLIDVVFALRILAAGEIIKANLKREADLLAAIVTRTVMQELRKHERLPQLHRHSDELFRFGLDDETFFSRHIALEMRARDHVERTELKRRVLKRYPNGDAVERAKVIGVVLMSRDRKST